MARRIVLFGATGYTGQLIAAALVRQRARPVLAGRSHQSLAALGVRLGKGLDTAVADVQRPESLLGIIQPHDVLISTVGPFAKYGRPAIEAAIYQRATYLDTSGEPQFIRSVYEELSPMAEQAGVPLLTAFGYEFVAGDVAASLALAAAGEAATRVDIGYFMLGSYRGGISQGTRASALGAALVPHYAWREGALRPAMAADRMHTFAVNGSDVHAIAIGGSEHITVPRKHPWVRDVGVFMGAGRRARQVRALAGAARATAKLPGAARAAAWLGGVSVGSEGPDAERRERSGAEVVAIASDDQGRTLHTVRLRGVNPYTFTGEIVAWAAMRLSKTPLDQSGALGAVQGFGLGPLRDACADAGLPVVDGS